MSDGQPTHDRTIDAGSPARLLAPMSPLTGPASDDWPERALTSVPEWSVIST